MTIEEAIEILTKTEKVMDPHGPRQVVDAIKLGIEALKRVKAYKEAHVGLHYEPMPGETED